MRGADQVYTPEAVATDLARVSGGEPRLVADFAAGEGALLAASARRWPEADHVALDVDPTVVASLTGAHPDWRVHQGDFLAEPGEIEDLVGRVDLVLLNPPFSCRGNAWTPAELGGEDLRCSRAMAFVCRALAYLSDVGELVAIVPASCLTSAKDAKARAAIGARYRVEILQAHQRSLFQGRAVAVAQVRIGPQAKGVNAWAPQAAEAQVRRLHAHYRVRVARGSLSMHEVADGEAGAPLIHTTDLREGRWTPSGRTCGKTVDIAAGETALVLPRVGRPHAGKLVLIEGPAVLSDCLFQLRTEPAGHEPELQRVLADAWTGLALLYGGSCAPYTTLAEVARFLGSVGIDAFVAPRRGRLSAQDGGGKATLAGLSAPAAPLSGARPARTAAAGNRRR